MRCTGRELLLLCSVLIIQHVTGSSYWCNNGCCCPNCGCCGRSYANNCGSYRGGWNGYQNCDQRYRRAANGGNGSDSCCGTGWSAPLSRTSNTGRWTDQGSGTGVGLSDPTIAANSMGLYGTSSNSRNGWITTRQVNNYSRSSSNRAGYESWNAPITFGERYPRSEDYRTTYETNYGLIPISRGGSGRVTNSYNRASSPYAVLDQSDYGMGSRQSSSGYTGSGYSRLGNDFGDANNINYRSITNDRLSSYSNNDGYGELNYLTGDNRYGESNSPSRLVGFNGRSISEGTTRVERDSIRAEANNNMYSDFISDFGFDPDRFAKRAGCGSTSVNSGWSRLRDARASNIDGSAYYGGLANYEIIPGTEWYPTASGAGSSNIQSQSAAQVVQNGLNWDTIRTAAGYNSNELVGGRVTQRDTPLSYIGNNVAANEVVLPSTRGDNYNLLDSVVPQILYFGGWSSNGNGPIYQDCDGNLYELWEEVSDDCV